MNSAVAYRNYDHAEAPDMSIEDWEPTVRKELSDTEVEAWIAEFAETGDMADEFGNYKSHRGTVLHACAQQWVANKGKLSDFIGPVFWRWARAATRMQIVGMN